MYVIKYDVRVSSTVVSTDMTECYEHTVCNTQTRPLVPVGL